MVEEIYLDNFKLFDKPTSISDLKRINIFTGVNGRGKSTSLQPLLLFAQTLMQNKSAESIALNGNLVKLGNTIDVKSVGASASTPIYIGFTCRTNKIVYELSAAEENNQALKILSVDDNGQNVQKTDKESFLSRFFLGNIVYIPADRISPQLSYKANSDDAWIGAKGEYSAQILYNKGKDPINDYLCKSLKEIFSDDFESVQQTVQGVTEFWLSKMFGETSIEVKYSSDTNLYVLKFSTEKLGAAQKFKPTDVGFGYTYVLPILVAGLTCSKDDALIIENPEAHLHPAAQSMIAKFLTLIANFGPQVFVETHSEHIINALRIMVAKKHIQSADASILYFDNSYEGYFKRIKVENNGKLSDWPAGFFDQSENDLSVLLGM